MADQNSPKPRRLWRVVFAVSLALNVAVVGLVVGVGMRDKVGGQSPRGFDLALGPIGQALRPEDRRAIGQALRKNPTLRNGGRAAMQDHLDAFTEALSAQPFSEAALTEVMEGATGRVLAIQDAARTALVARVAQMTDAERLALAERVSDIRDRRPKR